MSAIFGLLGIVIFIIGILILIFSFLRHKRKKVALILVILGGIFFVIGLLIPSSDKTKETIEETKVTKKSTSTTTSETEMITESSTSSIENSEEAAQNESESIEPETEMSTNETDDDYVKAMQSAFKILALEALSKAALTDRLKSQGYSDIDIEIAINNINQDWQNLALRAARQYGALHSGVTTEELLNYLKSAGFTDNEANYGANNFVPQGQ